MPMSAAVRRLTRSRCLGILAGVSCALAVLLGATAPPDRVQGQVQRLMYLHVPAAWTAYLCFALVLGASAAHLRTGSGRADRWAQAAAEAGVAMTALTLAVGSVWGHATWGVWWTWDARLVSTALMLLVYLAYLVIRGIGSRGVARRRAAVTGVAGFLMVPVVHFSVVWWRTLHQPPTLLAPTTSPPIAPVMLHALLAAVAAFTLSTAWWLSRRVRSLTPLTVASVTLSLPVQATPAPTPEPTELSSRR